MPRLRVPHTLVLLSGMIALALVATYVLPAGSFLRAQNEAGREQVVAGSYARLPDADALPPWSALTAVPRGFAAAADIIFFIFIVGGAFAVVRATGAPDAGIAALLRRLGHVPGLLLFGGMFVFAVGSSTIGMAEEYLPFVPLLVVLCRGMGYDAVTAVGVVCLGFGIGYGVATINPFTVLVAQDIAGLAPASGLGLRLLLFPLFLGIGFHHLWRYAQRVKREPSTSLVADQPLAGALSAPAVDAARMTRAHVACLGVTVGAFGLIVLGIQAWGWGLGEMGAVFLGLTLVLAACARMDADRVAEAFCAGAAELVTTALLVGFARAIIVVLEEGRVVDTIIHAIATPLGHLGASAAAVGMFVVQGLCSFVIPSGSGQAYVTMPIMAPLGDLVGVSRQTAVLAFQLGDGLTNSIVPTNAVLVGYLAMAGVPLERWLRFAVPLTLKLWLAAAVVLVVSVWIGYQ